MSNYTNKYHSSDGLTEIDKRHPELDVDTYGPEAYPALDFTDKSGIDVALDILNVEAPRSLSYIALGPLTTFAQLVRQHGDVVKSRIGQVVCMGGNLDVPGNTSAVAECMCLTCFCSSVSNVHSRSQLLCRSVCGEGAA